MAGMGVPFGDVLHQYGAGGGGAGIKMLHKRIAAKRQGPGGSGVTDGTGDGDPTGGLSLTRGPAGGGGGEGSSTGVDGSDSSTDAPTRTRTRTSISSTSSTTSQSSVSTPTTISSQSSVTTIPDDDTTSTTSSIPVTTTTVQSTSTSTSFSVPETTSTTLEEVTTSEETSSTSSTTSASRSLVTSFVTASGALTSLASSATNSLAPANNNNSSSGPSAGTVVGIVAGALVGVVVLSGIVGYVFRTKCSNKNDEDDFDGENPFGQIDDNNGGGFSSGQSRAEMRRDSQLLADDGDSIHQMSELGHGAYGNAAPAAMGMGMGMGAAAAAAGGAGAYALNRGNSTNNGVLPGLQRQDTVNPRPPTMIQRHYANQAYAQQQQQQQMQHNMPSFQPGQIVYPAGQTNQSSPYPTFPPAAAGAGAGGASSVPIGGVFPSSSQSGHDLARNQSYRAIPEQYNNNNDYGSGGYDYNADHQQEQPDIPARTGTPEYANPQQYFHQASDSFGSGIGASPFGDHNASPALANVYSSQQQPQQQQQYNNDGMGLGYAGGQQQMAMADGGATGQRYATTPREGGMKGSDRAKRTLSVRNGALDDDGILRESVYGGM